MLCATFPTVPVVALAATASKRDLKAIKESLNLKNPVEVAFRKGDDVDFFEEILKPIALGLKEKTVGYPITILYLPLRWCGFSFKFFEMLLGDDQYHSLQSPGNEIACVPKIPENRLFAQYHAPQTTAMKELTL